MTLRIALVEHHELFADTLDIALTMNGHTVVRVAPPEGAEAVAGLVNRVLTAHPEVDHMAVAKSVPVVDLRGVTRPPRVDRKRFNRSAVTPSIFERKAA